ncbi:MAG TPA: protein phosphatase 2C domain-containing protein [Solirubrobacterales bacterium]|nr:protein phosphatase 2C domain-containing protein [Solirubrobacterales bacterium]
MSHPQTPADVDADLGGIHFQGELLRLPAEGKDQDAALVGDGFVGLADGSTPLLESGEIDALAYAQGALERLRRHSALTPEGMFREALAAAEPPREPIAHRPSCTVVALTAGREYLLCSLLGDCLAVVRRRDGRCVVAWDRRLERFDGPVAEKMAGDVAAGMSLEAAREAAGPQLIANRNEANAEGTYWLFADDPAAADHLLVTSVPLGEVESILLCTDGFTRLIEPLGIARDPEELIRRAAEEGLAGLGSELRSAETAPESFTRYPRLDVSDDATAVLLRP